MLQTLLHRQQTQLHKRQMLQRKQTQQARMPLFLQQMLLLGMRTKKHRTHQTLLIGQMMQHKLQRTLLPEHFLSLMGSRQHQGKRMQARLFKFRVVTMFTRFQRFCLLKTVEQVLQAQRE